MATRPKPYPLSPAQLLAHAEQIREPRAKALFSFLYLTGARISEAVRVKPVDVVYEDEVLARVRLEVHKKRRAVPRRVVPIPKGRAAKCYEDLFWRYVKDFLFMHDSLEMPFRVWRNMSEWIAREVPPMEVLAVLPDGREGYIEKRFNPHFLRHARASHLVEYYGARDHQLRVFFGWADTRMASQYVEMREVDTIFFEKPITNRTP